MKKTKRLWAWLLTLMLCVGAIDFTGLSAYAAEDEEAITLENDGESGYDKVVVIDEENPTGIEEDDFLEENTTYTLGLLQGCTAYRDPYYKTKIPDGTKISVPNALYLNTPTPDRKVFDCYAIGLGNGSPNLVEVTMVTEVRKNIYPVHDPKAYFLIPDYSSWSDEYKNMTMLYIQPIYKDAPGPFIDEVNINVTTPKSGKSPSFTATTDNEDCMIQDGKVTWTDVKTNKTLTESSKFEAGKQYLATILLNPYDTYTIDSYTNVYINGNKAEFKGSVSEGTYKFTYEFRVDVVNVTVTEPVDGAHPDFTATTDSELCTVMDGNVSWYDETLNHFMTADEKYKLGGTYSARIWLTKKDGYTIGKKTEV